MSDETVMQAGDRQSDRGLPEWRTDTFISARGLAREGEDSIAKHALTYALDVAEKACRERDEARAEVERLRAERNEALAERDALRHVRIEQGDLIARLRRERDDARGMLIRARKQHVKTCLARDEARAERDEAREDLDDATREVIALRGAALAVVSEFEDCPVSPVRLDALRDLRAAIEGEGGDDE